MEGKFLYEDPIPVLLYSRSSQLRITSGLEGNVENLHIRGMDLLYAEIYAGYF